MSGTPAVEMVYLADSDLELARPADDVRRLIVVDPNGHRVGEVQDLVVDAQERRARLLSVVSGGLLGLDRSERLIPVEVVTRVDDRVHVNRDHAEVHALPRADAGPAPAAGLAAGSSPFADVYGYYDIAPFWSPGSGLQTL